MLKEIAQYIENQTSLVIGTDLYIGHRTVDANDECTLLLNNTGSTVYFDLPDRIDLNLQVLTRGTSYLTTEDTAIEVYDVLKRNEHITLPVTDSDILLVQIFEARDYPKFIGLDERGLYEFSCNYMLKIKKN